MTKELTEEEKKENLYDIVSRYGDRIHDAIHCVFGMTGWFKGFLNSKEFDQLTPERKVEAFDTYERIKWLLEHFEWLEIPDPEEKPARKSKLS